MSQQVTLCNQQQRTLPKAVALFLEKTDTPSLEAARSQWSQNHQCLIQVQPLLVVGQVDQRFAALDDFRQLLDTHPIQPGYLDYFDVYTHSGIVNDIAVPITASAIRAQHGLTDIGDVSLGLHAMEYLLWGEKGERPLMDFIAVAPADSKLAANEQPNQRRRQLLALLSQLFSEDLQRLQLQLGEQQPLSLLYQQLSAPQRLTLWQQVSLKLIRGLDNIHSQFADDAQAQRQVLAATLEKIWFSSEPALAQTVWPDEQSQRLLQQLQDLQQSLSAEDELQPHTTAAQTEAMAQQLAALETFFTGVMNEQPR